MSNTELIIVALKNYQYLIDSASWSTGREKTEDEVERLDQVEKIINELER